MPFDSSSAVLEDEPKAAPAFDASSAVPEFDTASAVPESLDYPETQGALVTGGEVAPPEPDISAGDIARRSAAGIAKAGAVAGQGLLYAAEKLKPQFTEYTEPARQFLRDVQDRAAADYGVDPERDKQLVSKIVEGAGSVVPLLASGGTLAPVTAAALLGESARQDAEASGATEGQQAAAFGIGAATGVVTEALLGVPALLRSAKAAGADDAVIKSMARKLVEQGLKNSAREATQETIEQLSQNFAANTLVGYDPSRPTTQGVGEAAKLGAIIGGPIGAGVQTAASLSAAVDADAKRILSQPIEQTAVETTLPPQVAPIPGVTTETATAIQSTTEPAPSAPQESAQPQVETQIASQGPGAASAYEQLADYEERKFAGRFQEDKGIAPEIREATGNRFYEPVPNIQTVKEAESIIDQRGIDESTRLVRDPEFPMEHRVRSVMAQGLIKKLNADFQQTGNQESLNKAVDVAEYLSELGTKLGQGVQSFAVWSRLTPEGMLMAAKRTAKRAGTELSPEAEKKIADLTAEINKAPEGFQRDEKTMDLLAYMSELKGVDAADVPTALWYANILSGYSTQLVNTIDTGLNVLSESAAMAVSHPTAVPDILGGLYQGLIRGGFEAASVLKTGKSRGGENKLQVPSVLERTVFGTKGGVPISEASAVGRFMKRAFESKVATPLNLWKYPLRAMVASDTAFYHSFKEARARILARGLAKKEGLTGDKLFTRVDQALNSTPGRREAAAKQADSEGLTGLRKQRRVHEIIEQGRPEELVSAADEAAKIATYNFRPEGTLGLIADRIGSITEGFKPAKAIVPFTRIVANVTNRALDYTPYGYKRLFFGRSGGKGFETAAPTDEAFKTQLVKATLGTAAMAAVGVLDAAGKIQVTAKGPADDDERNQLKNAGWKAYSVRIGDTWYSYQYTPLNLGFAIVGHYRDALRYNKLGEKDVQTRLAYAMLKAGGSVFEMSFLSGVSDFIETIQGARASTKAASRILSRTATSVILPNLVKQLDRLFDPTIYQADSVQESLVRETPVARRALRPMLNVLGEKIQYDNNRFFASEKSDPVWRFIVEKQAWIPVPSKTSKIGNRPITPEEYYDLIEKSGPKIRASLEQDLDALKALPAQQAQEVVSERAISIRKSVKAGLTRKPQP